MKIVLFVLSSVLIFGCATSPSRVQVDAFPEKSPEKERESVQLSDDSLRALREIEKEILEADSEISEIHAIDQKNDFLKSESSAKRVRIPIEINESVRRWIHYFTVKDRDRFHRFLKRGNAYKTVVQDILRRNHVPTDLYYLAMIESGYVTHAQSHARAVGVWQFIPGTGLRYGLNQNRYLDERRDVIRSTEAAAKYLKSLHTAFQSWYLAMAGYNAGEGRILGAIMKGESRDFWELVEKKALPSETRNYVPKFLAAVIIGKHPERYGFSDLEADPFPEVAAVELPGGVRLRDIAARSRFSLKTLQQVNPHLVLGLTPVENKTYPVWVPVQGVAQVARVASELPRVIAKAKKQEQKPLRGQRSLHVVRRGESLSEIARRYRTSVVRLRQMNGLRSNRITVGRKLRVQAGSVAVSGRRSLQAL